MSIKSLLGRALFALFVLQLVVTAGQRPNIVIIYADDLGYGDLSSYGGTVETPRIDQLAKEGILFRSAYSDAATCTPARYALLTGEHSFRNDRAEILPGNAPLIIDPSRPTMPSFLRDNGYKTAIVGKWHLGLGGEELDWNGEIKPGPAEVGFDYSFCMAATADRVPSVYIENGRVVNLDPADPIYVHYEQQVGNEFTGLSHPEILKWRADPQHSGTIVNGISRIGYMTGGEAARFRDEDMLDEYVDKATSFIHQNKNNPFFLYFAPNEPHVPRAVHERFQGKTPLGPRGDALVALDWAVGQMMDVLKAEGLIENTLLIVSSDNGGVLFDGYFDEAVEKNGNHKPNGPFRGGKYSRWEGGTRVPFIVSWPERTKPGESDALISQVDLFASFAALLDVPMPEGSSEDSRNVLPALLGESDQGRDHIVQQAWKQLAIRKGDWKYVAPGTVSIRGDLEKWHYTKVDEPGFLFNLAEDPGEITNVAAKHPEIVEELRALYEQVKQVPISQSSPVKDIQSLLAPARIINDVASKPPEAIRFEKISDSAFRLSGELPNKQATVVLKPAEGVWDVSAYSFFRVDFVNNGPGLVWIRGRLDNPGALDWADSTPSQAFAMPGERVTLGFAYPRAKELNDADPIFDKQSGKPNGHREHWKAFDPTNVIACRLIIQSTSPTLALDDLTVSLAYPYGVSANAERMELPYLDKFGQVRQLNWPGKLYTEQELRDRNAEESARLAEDTGPASFNQYGGWAKGPLFKATGFFRTERVEGKWWIIDPEGRLFFSHGANSVGFDQTTPITGREALFAWLPGVDDPLMNGVVRNERMHFMAANLARTFGLSWQEPARDRVHRRLRQWGMNTIGAWSDSGLIADKRTPYTPILHVGGDWSPLGKKIADPFEPDFKVRMVENLRRLVPDPKDPWCLGVFIDNEIYWTEPFVQNAFKRGAKQPARNAAVEWLKNQHGTIEKLNTAWGTTYTSWDAIGDWPTNETDVLKADLSALKRLISGTYYRLCREAMREALPNYLYLGSRQHKADLEVYEESAKYVDVLSLNSYEPLSGSKVPKGVDVPCMDTEFHFGAPDRGVPGVGLWPVGDQTQRTRAYIAYVVSGLRHPNVVGTHWFAFPDQSAAGRPGENYQIGFVDVTDTPYLEITAATRVMAEKMYELGTETSVGLLESLEALWRNQEKVSSGKIAPAPAVSTTPIETSLPYRIENSHGLSLTTREDMHVADGKGPFNILLKPSSGNVWDMSNVKMIGLEFKNTGKTDLVLDLMARNEGATDWSDSAFGRTVVKAGETMPLGIALQRLADYRTTHRAYLRMSGRPNGYFRHWHTFDPARVKDLVISCTAPGEHSFELGRMFPLQNINEELTEVLPILDRFGQYVHNTWPGKVASDNDIRANSDVEAALVREVKPSKDFNKYGGWKTGPPLKATGFFRTEKVKGKWWFVDPEGCLFWSFGVSSVGIEFAGQTPTERDPDVFQDLPSPDDEPYGQFHVKLSVEDNFVARHNVPHYDFTRANLFRKYGSSWKDKQVDQDIQRLKRFNINTIGAWSDTDIIARKERPYVAMLHYEFPDAGHKLPDPFANETRMNVRKELNAYPVNFKDDPWCLGAFVDNELHWKNDSRHLVAAILGHDKTGTEARKVFRDWLGKKYTTIEALNTAWKTSLRSWGDLLTITDPSVFADANQADCSALATLFAETFFRMIREELTAYSANVLYLGCRMNSAPPEVITALGKYADVITANIYAYRPNPGRYGAVDKPVLISEFHFANVTGNNLGGGLRSAQDAVQQGRLLRTYMDEAVRHPQIVGAHWYQWRDQNAAGRYDGENFNIGLIDIADGLNLELVRAMEECGRNLYPSTL